MEQKERFFTGMPGPQVDAGQLSDALEKVLQHTADFGMPALETFARLQQRRADRMTEVAGALRKKLGKDHPNVLALENTARSLNELKTRMDAQRARLEKWPKVRAHEWAVFGTVIDEQGLPAAGLTVRVLDRDRKYDDLLGETETDEHGDFSVIYHERDFAETRENLPELYVTVTDAAGKELYSSGENILFEAGRSEYFSIRLGKRSKTTKDKSGPASKTSRKTSRPKKSPPEQPNIRAED